MSMNTRFSALTIYFVIILIILWKILQIVHQMWYSTILMMMVTSILAPSFAVFQATTVLDKVLNTACVDVSACNYCDISIVIECTARPTPLRNVTVQPSQTSLLIEWMEPEQLYGQFDAYYVVCGTQTAYTHSITETAVNITGLSVFTRYECCATVYVFYSILRSTPNCVNATTAPGIYVVC